MSKISLAPDASGTGIFTIASPNSNTNHTLTLPDDTGTIVTNSGNQAGSFTTLTTSSTVTHNGGTANGVAFLNGSNVLTAGSALSFNGTVLQNTQSSAADGIMMGLQNTTTGSFIQFAQPGVANLLFGCPNADAFVWKTFGGGTYPERMRITSGGNLTQFSSAGSDPFYPVSAEAAGTTRWLILGHHSASSTTSLGTSSFGVFTNGNVVNTNNSYGTLSDVKLKQDIVDAASQWDDLKAIRIRKFRFKNDPTGPLQIGLVAQELEEVSPGLVDEHPDTEEVEIPVIDDEGNPVLNEDGTPQVKTERRETGETTKSVKATILYMKAVKALQEAMERIETLEASNTALEARIAALEGQ
jgi:hypothetical protein